MPKDVFIDMWESNYNKNVSDGNFSKSNTKPLNWLINNPHYQNYPATLVVAGPSLDNTIHKLKDGVDKTIIYCADIALYKLIENGITPDFVVNIDPHETIVDYWRGIDTSNLTLICPTTTNPNKALSRITKATENITSLMNNYFVGATLLQVAAIFNPYLVCLMGYDFSYGPNDEIYCDGVIDLKIAADIPRDSEEYAKEFSDIQKRGLRHEITYKESLKTNKLFLLYARTLYKLLIKSKTPVVNCTEGGIFDMVKQQNYEDILTEILYDSTINRVNLFSALKRRKRKPKKS